MGRIFGIYYRASEGSEGEEESETLFALNFSWS